MISSVALGFPIKTTENDDRESRLSRRILRDSTNVFEIDQFISNFRVNKEVFSNLLEDLGPSSWFWELVHRVYQGTKLDRVTRDDGLPQNICALCVSYLKHAHTFREKATDTCLSFIAVKEYKDILKGKKEWNYDEIVSDMVLKPQPNNNDSNTSGPPPSNTDDDNSTNCYYKDQNKVNKRLITGSDGKDSLVRPLSNQTKNFLLYLTKIHDNVGGGDYGQDPSTSFKGAQKRYNLTKSSSSGEMATDSGLCGFSRKRQNCDDEYLRNISSDEYDEPESSNGNGSGNSGPIKSNNIFSYKEKIFEEDDIMDLEELKDLISMNIESTCKEHKCVYCSRRFMFEESIQEHLKTCIDFKFAEFFEEVKNLMYIKRCKEISPHEYIRRMIFSIRKICEWLKESLIDTTLPDLQQDSENNRLETDLKIDDVKATNVLETENTPLILRHNPINVNNNILHAVAKSQAIPKVNKPVIASSFLQDNIIPNARNTPINISNNILHEIERSENREANKMTLKKPIPILATSGLNNKNNHASSATQNPERLAFLEKLQNAAKGTTPPPMASLFLTTTPTKENLQPNTIPLTPLIAVRRDLMENTTTTSTMTRKADVSPLLELLQNSSISQNVPLNPCARCPQCNLVFETLDALEIHNAMQHNAVLRTNLSTTENKQEVSNMLDEEHERIIALFENEDEF